MTRAGRLVAACAAAATMLLTSAGVAPAAPGGVFVTGHDPDFHAHLGGNAVGAQHIIQRAVAYTTHGHPSPSMLLVTSLTDGGHGHSDPQLGVTAAGFTFHVADYGSGRDGALDLHTVDFEDYDVVLVASDFGGWLSQLELDALNARGDDVRAFVNRGGGLVALSESGLENNLTTRNRFDFLPFLIVGVPSQPSPYGHTLEKTGLDMGLTTADIDGNQDHTYFTQYTGMEVVDRYSDGQVASVATQLYVTPGGATPVPPPGLNRPPVCTGVTVSPDEVAWKPGLGSVPVAVAGGSDPDGDRVTLRIADVVQDVAGTRVPADWQAGATPGEALLRIRRPKAGEGRSYVVSFEASDGNGGTCTGEATIAVPPVAKGNPR